MDELAQQLAWVAGDLESRGYQFSAVVRRGAWRLIDVPEGDDDGCRGCREPLEQPARGRPREWCSERCRRRHRR